MSTFSTFFVGMSGLNANSQWLAGIGNNIANMNTVAFKASQPRFSEMVGGLLAGGGHGEDGMGVAVSRPQVNFAQGPLAASNNPMDWAIDGNGFFVVKDFAGNSFYTRAGQFKIQAGATTDKITDATGHVLQGYLPNEKGVIGDTLGEVAFATEMKAKATSKAAMTLNLESSSTVPTAAFDVEDATTYNFSVSDKFFDSRTDGSDVAHTLTAYFAKTDDNTWDVYAQVDDGEAADAGELTFDTSGVMTSGAKQTVTVAVPIPGTPDAADGTPGTPDTILSQTLALDFTGTTQYAMTSAINNQSQDGYNLGRLDTITLGENGRIIGNFSNQQHQTVAQVALASFEAPSELTQMEKGLFAASQASGAATTVKPGGAVLAGQASVGQVLANTLELSNVEITDNFVDMMAAQFGFQANSQAIKTTDEVVQILVGLKR
nr:flagellar hook protein FlgE [Nitrospirota bacterium]